jgi:hypothetical protein
VDGEEHGAASVQPPGDPARGPREDLGASGWTTTKQAAKVLGVSRRSVQGYVGRGILEAREEGEGVNRRFLVSIDSLNALAERRRSEADSPANFAEASPLSEATANPFANTGEGLRHLIARLEARTEEATELRMHLEIAERAQSTLEEERASALDELADERRRREEAEAERDELRSRLATREDASESAEHPVPPPPEAALGAQEATEQAQAGPEERSWWRRIFGG